LPSQFTQTPQLVFCDCPYTVPGTFSSLKPPGIENVVKLSDALKYIKIQQQRSLHISKLMTSLMDV